MTTTRMTKVPDPPQSADAEIYAKLTDARTRAVDSILAAEEAEAKARALRRTATARLKNYEALLLEHSGQLRIPMEGP